MFILVAILLLYFSIAIYTRKKLSGNSRLIANMINMHIKEIKESLGSIKDIIVYNSQKYFRDRFNNIDRKLRFAKAENLFLAFGPRYLIEALGISLLILIILLFKVSNTEYKIIPLLATLAFGSQKLLSEIQMGYQAWAKFYSVGRTFDIILNLISQQYINPAVSNSFKTIKSFNNIVLENVCFGFQKRLSFIEDDYRGVSEDNQQPDECQKYKHRNMYLRQIINMSRRCVRHSIVQAPGCLVYLTSTKAVCLTLARKSTKRKS